MPGKRIHVHFRVAFFTKWGQNLALVGAGALLGNWKVSKGHTMRCHHEKDVLVWEALLTLPWQPQYNYRYVLVQGENEEGEPIVDKSEMCDHQLVLHEGLKHDDIVEVLDTWVDQSYPGSILTTAAFTKVLKVSRPALLYAVVQPSRLEPANGEVVVRLRVADFFMGAGQSLCVTGSLPQLGAWQQDHMMHLTEMEGRWWEGELRVPFSQFPFTFKYAVITEKSTELGALLEVGEPRLVTLPLSGGVNMGAPALLVCQDGFFRRDKLWRGTGVAVPVFSLRTRQSVGCGEFLDLIQLVDFADRCGLRLIQLLPVNDTSVYDMWWDSYPYSTVSVFALHPQYLALRALRQALPDDLADELEVARSQLSGPMVDYEATIKFKKAFARKVYDRFGVETLESSDFKSWFAEHKVWLQPYAAFCYLKDLFQTAEHWQWGVLSTPPDQATINRLTDPRADHYPAISFIYFVQYQLHLQLLSVTRHAEKCRVVLKGDLPIGVDKRSADTWVAPNLFRMDKSTGAPPDMFDPNGQNWGFPTYAWEEMAKDGYAWWKRRLHHMQQYFHAYRIDHVLGFFRIWEIPGDCVTGLLGYFRPSNPIWRNELESKGMGLDALPRLVEPYIRGHLLLGLFGKQWQEVAARYLTEWSEGCFKFRPQWGSEKAISEIKVRDDSPHWLKEETARIRKGLMVLRQNVVLIADPEDKDKFYPRFQLMSTTSFKDLDQKWRDALAWLHDDYYFRRQDDCWRASALSKLPALQAASDMLVFGEDLGFVPACVPPVMQELGLLGLRIQRMPTESGREFNNPNNYPYMVAVSPSCHDVQPLRAWYESDPERRDRFYFTALGGTGDVPMTCTPEIVRAVTHQHVACPSAWAIFPLQDIMALSGRYHNRPAAEEVINDPTNPKHYWRFRIQPALEELIEDVTLVGMVQELLVMSGRASAEELLPP